MATARVTAIKPLDGHRAAVELDGRPWRTIPVTAVVAAGLGVGAELTRNAARTVRQELRRAEAAEAAAALLRHRDRSSAELEHRLGRRGIAPGTRRELLDALERGGLVDDARLASRRGTQLATRGWGDLAIAERLASAGVSRELREQAIAGLPHESERARLLVSTRSVSGARAAALLRQRGFGEDALEDALGVADGWTD